jgi:hypothetical protein
MKKFFFLVYLTFFQFQNLKAQEKFSRNELSQKLTNFYQNPDSVTLNKIVATLSASSEDQEKMPPTVVIGFCTSLLLLRDENSAVLDRELKKHVAENQLFPFILSLKNTRDTIVHWPAHSPEVNDMMWSAYFGTGNSKYLERLIGELKYVSREDSLVLFLTGNSAKWSLASNARQHNSVDKFLRAKMNVAPEDLRTVISEALTKEPVAIRDEFTARLKEMKAKGLIPDQNSTDAEPKISPVEKEKSSDIGISWDNHQARFVIESKSVKILNKSFFDVDGQVIQFVTVKIPSNMDLENLTPEKSKSILQGYVQYEMQYFRNELKLEVSDFTSDFTTLSNNYFVRWKFKANTKSKDSGDNLTQQVYYTTVCWDRVVSINSPITAKDNFKHYEKRLEAIAKTLTMK